MTLELLVDAERMELGALTTGIPVYAKLPSGGSGPVDLAHLTPESLKAFLRSTGGFNPLAEGGVLALMGYGEEGSSLVEEFPAEHSPESWQEAFAILACYTKQSGGLFTVEGASGHVLVFIDPGVVSQEHALRLARLGWKPGDGNFARESRWNL